MNENIEMQYLYESPIHLFYKPEQLEKVISEFKNKNYKIHDLNATPWNSEEAFHTGIAQTLQFPDYYGKNFSGLTDCLSDLFTPEISGMIFVFRNFDVLEKFNHEFAEQVLDVFAEQSRKFLVQGMKCIILVHSNNPQIAFRPVGASPVLWNPSEWQDAQRGL